MQKLVLPPKRYEDPADSKYDPIRHKPWFARLLHRREKIPILKAAAKEYKTNAWKPVAKIALSYDVDERELRDYMKFDGNFAVTSLEFGVAMAICELAYNAYCNDKAEEPFQAYVEYFAKRFGVSPRAAVEMWDVDALIIPTGIEPIDRYEKMMLKMEKEVKRGGK